MTFQITVAEIPHENNTVERGPWMLTAQGNQFFPLDPRVEDFRLEEISGSLSKTCRYNGQLPGEQFYSVGEHCTILAKYFLKKKELVNARWAWAHDGAESIIGDMIRPIKWLFPEFVKIEHKIEKVYFHEFLGLEGVCPDDVKHADTIICNDERNQLWQGVKNHKGELVCEKYGYDKKELLGIKVNCWSHKKAKKEYLKMYDRLFINV